MRVTIVKPPTGQIDGMPLGRFELGKTYDVSTSLGTYLLVTNAAIPVADESPALIVPLENLPKKRPTVRTSPKKR